MFLILLNYSLNLLAKAFEKINSLVANLQFNNKIQRNY